MGSFVDSFVGIVVVVVGTAVAVALAAAVVVAGMELSALVVESYLFVCC